MHSGDERRLRQVGVQVSLILNIFVRHFFRSLGLHSMSVVCSSSVDRSFKSVLPVFVYPHVSVASDCMLINGSAPAECHCVAQ